MSAVAGATEVLPIPSTGRRFDDDRVVRLGDVDVDSCLRLDATARYLQDVATDDANDALLDGSRGWVVRRTRIVVEQAAALDERLAITTYCTGFGRSWAERTTVLRGDRGARIDTVSVWVQVDVRTARPAPLSDQFREIYGEACDDRRVSARLSLPAPVGDLGRRPWRVRRTDLDPFRHVNNAANWAFFEEAIAGVDGSARPSRVGCAEMEFIAPVVYGDPVEIAVDRSDGVGAWLVSGDRVLSAARWTGSG